MKNSETLEVKVDTIAEVPPSVKNNLPQFFPSPVNIALQTHPDSPHDALEPQSASTAQSF